MALQHWMTFGTFAEQRYYIYPSPDSCTGIIFNGNMAVHAPDGLSAFLIEKTRPKMPYIIDPITHAFQHDVDSISSRRKDGTVEIKTPIKNLARIYGSPVNEILGQRPLRSRDLEDNQIIEEFTKNVLDFQKDQLSLRMLENSVNKKYLEHTVDELIPYALITPYFYITETSYKPWLNIMHRAIEISKQNESYNEHKIFGALVLSKGILTNQYVLNDVMEFAKEAICDGFLLWIDGLDEHNSGISELVGLLTLGASARNSGKEIINLHGGYFSILAGGGKFGNSFFSGVAHGAEFGETRKVIPVGGGIPIAKYYIRDLHKRVKYSDAVYFLNSMGYLKDAETFHQKVCNCEECIATLNGQIENFKLFGLTDSKPVKRSYGFVTLDYPTKETKEHCLKHFLQSKSWEYNLVESTEKDELVRRLTNAFDKYSDIASEEYLSYIPIWLEAFDREF